MDIVLIGTLLVTCGVVGAAMLGAKALEERRKQRIALVRSRIGGADATNREELVWLAGNQRRGSVAVLDRWAMQRGEGSAIVVVLQALGLGALGIGVVSWIGGLPLGFAGVLLGALPILLLQRQAEAVALALSKQLPQGLDLVSRALRSGHALPEALHMGSSELPDPLASQFRRVSEETRMGIELRVALEHLVERNPLCFDLRMLASAVMLQRETGASLTEMIDQLAETIRERMVFKSKVEALTAEVRASAMILGALPFVVGTMLLIMRPGYLRPLVETELGQQLFTAGAISLTVGWGLMRKLAQVET